MKMYELFLENKKLGIFKEEPQDIVYCDGSTDGIDLLCFNSDEWQMLQAKLNIVLTDDELDNFNKITRIDEHTIEVESGMSMGYLSNYFLQKVKKYA